MEEHTKLAELTIGENQRSECSETVECLVAVLLCSCTVNGSIGSTSATTRNGLALPDEILNEIALVLAKKQHLSFFDDIPQVSNEIATLVRELG